MDLTVMPYTIAPLMDLFSEEAMTLPFTWHLVTNPIPALALLTAHQAGTAMETPSATHFWQAILLLIQTK